LLSSAVDEPALDTTQGEAMDIIKRSVLVLTIAGSVGLACGGLGTILSTVSICYDECPPESELASTLLERFASAAGLLVPGLLPLLAAWVLSLVVFVRFRRWPWAAAVFLALPLSLALSVGTILRATGGHVLPVNWTQNAFWGPSLTPALLLLFIWPLAILLASRSLPHASPAPRPASPEHS
jgi:hypothetical protein